MRWCCAVLMALAVCVGAARSEDSKEPPIVMEDRPLTAVGQHSPALSTRDGWIAYLRYVVGPAGETGQALCLDSLVAPGREKRLTSTSVVYHPSWRVGAARIVCVAIPQNTEKRAGIYEIDASGDSDPILILPASREALPYAPTVSPDDRQLAYFGYSNDPDPARRGEIALTVLNFSEGRSFGEVPPFEKEPFRISDCSGPWWHASGVVRLVGERRTPQGPRLAVYEFRLPKKEWRRVFELRETSGVESFAYSPEGSRLAYLRETTTPGQMDVVLCDGEGRNPTVLTTIARPVKLTPRPFPADVAWLPDGQSLVVVSAGNLRLLRLGKASEADERVCRSNLQVLYRALQRFAYDHGGAYPPPAPGGEPGQPPAPDPARWVGAIRDAYVDSPGVFYCPFDARPHEERPSSYVFNPLLFGTLFDQQAVMRDLPLLWEEDPWHKNSILVLYTDGRIALVASPPNPAGTIPDIPRVERHQ
jgi:hypothetical protein